MGVTFLAARTTAAGPAGLTSVEILGPELRSRLRDLLGERGPGAPGALPLVPLAVGSEILDEAVLRWQTWGDLDHVTLQVHGCVALVEQLLGALERLGARVVSGACLVQHRALAAGAPPRAAWAGGLLGETSSLRGAAIVAAQAGGALEDWARHLTGAPAAALRRAAEQLLGCGRLGRACLRPPLVALVGPTNAGASSLINALAGGEQLLVHPEPGTTRDRVQVPAEVAGLEVLLQETPGMWPGAPADADLVLEVIDGRGEPPDPVTPGRIRALTFADLPTCSGGGGGVRVSSWTGEGIEELRVALARGLQLEGDDAGPVPLHEIELGILEAMRSCAGNPEEGLTWLLDPRLDGRWREA